MKIARCAIVTESIDLKNCEYKSKVFKNHIINVSAYAKKVGACLEVIEEPKYKNINLKKNQIYDLFNKYDRILRVLPEILISDSCPNLFEYPEQYIYASRENYENFNENCIYNGFILCSKMHRDIYKIYQDEENLINEDRINFFENYLKLYKSDGRDLSSKHIEQSIINWKIKKLNFEIKDLGPNFNYTHCNPAHKSPRDPKFINLSEIEVVDQYQISCAFDKNKNYTLFPNEHLQGLFGHFPNTMEYFFKAISLSILSGGKLEVIAPHKHSNLSRYNEGFLKSLENLKGVRWNHERYLNPDQVLKIKTSPEWCPHLQKFDDTQNWFQDKKIASILRNHILGAPKLIRRTPKIGFINRTDSRGLDFVEFIKFVEQYFKLKCKEIVFDDLSFFDQIKFFNDHDIIISPHGAQLTSIPYMPDFGYVVEINTPEYFRPAYYGSLAQSSGKNYISYCHNLKLSDDLLNQKEIYQARSKNATVDYDSLAGLIKYIIDERLKAIEWNDKSCRALQFFNEIGYFQRIHLL